MFLYSSWGKPLRGGAAVEETLSRKIRVVLHKNITVHYFTSRNCGYKSVCCYCIRKKCFLQHYIQQKLEFFFGKLQKTNCNRLKNTQFLYSSWGKPSLGGAAVEETP